MDRSRRTRLLGCTLLLIVAAAAVPASGCVNALAGVLYVIKGNNIDPEFNGLRGKRVVVVCRATTDLQFSSSTAAHELADQIGRLLSANVRKIDVVSQSSVETWIDENEWEEFSEVGKALKAQMIVGVDVDQFSLYQGSTVYQGRAVYRLRVIDMEQDGEVVFQKDPPQSIWPPNYEVSTQEKREIEFRREFIGVLSEEIVRHFYPHEAYAEIAPISR